jgi:A/G-specific adenine glycosylase
MNNKISPRLLQWYSQNKRDLPWRESRDPYKIWLSEIILQQTRIIQGLAYYHRFISQYPDIFQLAGAPTDEVYKLWQGLGYYNRASNLIKCAKIVANERQGRFPEKLSDLKKLPGIGDYTAAAIASMAFKKAHPVVDGNVFRLLSRVFGINTPINTSQGKKEFTEIAQKLLENHPPDLFNQAMMEFGALACTPKNPLCESCPLQPYCYAYKYQKQDQFPVKRPKAKVKKRYIYYFVFQTQDQGNPAFYLKKRTQKDIWRNLYDFPSVEAQKPFTYPLDVLEKFPEQAWISEYSASIGHVSRTYVHQLTHIKITACFIPVILKDKLPPDSKNSLLLIHQNNLHQYPVSRLVAKYLTDQEITHL